MTGDSQEDEPRPSNFLRDATNSALELAAMYQRTAVRQDSRRASVFPARFSGSCGSDLELVDGGKARASEAGGRSMDDQPCDTREGFGRRALLRAVLLVALAAGTLLLDATLGTTSAKDQCIYFAEAFTFVSSDSPGVETTMLVQAVDRPTRPDGVTRSDPE